MDYALSDIHRLPHEQKLVQEPKLYVEVTVLSSHVCLRMAFYSKMQLPYLTHLLALLFNASGDDFFMKQNRSEVLYACLINKHRCVFLLK